MNFWCFATRQTGYASSDPAGAAAKFGEDDARIDVRVYGASLQQQEACMGSTPSRIPHVRHATEEIFRALRERKVPVVSTGVEADAAIAALAAGHKQLLGSGAAAASSRNQLLVISNDGDLLISPGLLVINPNRWDHLKGAFVTWYHSELRAIRPAQPL